MGGGRGEGVGGGKGRRERGRDEGSLTRCAGVDVGSEERKAVVERAAGVFRPQRLEAD